MNSHDRDLYESFAALRREEETRVPNFTEPSPSVSRYGSWRLRRTLFVATACLAIMIAAAFWLVSSSRIRNQRRQQATVSITTWKPATDFLLNTPGREVLYNVPTVGQWSGPAVPRPASERHRRSSKQVSQ
jgi:hypothetical protein